jgi:hypothetical protein
MNHCKTKSLLWSQKEIFEYNDLLSLDAQNVSHLLLTKQFQVMFHSDL